MKHRGLIWIFVVLFAGALISVYCAAQMQGTWRIVLSVVGAVLGAAGLVVLFFFERYAQKARLEEMSQDDAEQRAALERAKYLLLLYLGKKKRLGAPTEKDRFSFEAFLTEDRAEIESYLDGAMSGERYDRFYEENVCFVCTLNISLRELSDLRDKVIFVSPDEYEVMRGSDAYRTVFANNEVVPR